MDPDILPLNDEFSIGTIIRMRNGDYMLFGAVFTPPD